MMSKVHRPESIHNAKTINSENIPPPTFLLSYS